MNRTIVVLLFAAPLLVAQVLPNDAGKARVFITDSQSWSIAGGGGANGARTGRMAA